MTVDIDLFVETMTNRWRNELGNQPSKPLQQTWKQICSTFNRQIQSANNNQLQVLQSPTGTGKTQCVAVYCSMLSSMPVTIDSQAILSGLPQPPMHPGVLVISRRIDEVDGLVKQINELSGIDTANAYHSNNRLTENEIVNSPVLVITHAAYINALKAIRIKGFTDARWILLNLWQHSERGLVIIDESLDFIEHFKLDIEIAKQALAFIPDYIGIKFPEQINYLKRLIGWLQDLSAENCSERMLPADCMLSNCPDFNDLRKALRAVRLDRSVVRENNNGSDKQLHKSITETFDAIEEIVNQWSYFSTSGVRGTVNSARCLLPENQRGAVIMDATASNDLLYRLFENRVALIPTPEGARRYDNVTLHVSKGHKVGKGYLAENAKIECPKLISELMQSCKNAKKLLIVCHKDVEPYLTDYKGKFTTLKVCHWGEIDGRNSWDDIDTVAIFGLPYRNSTWSVNSYMAIQGPQQNDWFHENGNRGFGDYSDIREELNTGVLTTSVIQAINRVRCRRVIDSDGNCAPTDVYLLLPQDKKGDAIFQSILKAMPGIQPVNWSYSGATKKVRKSKYEASLLAYLKNQFPGTISATEIKKELGIPSTSFENLIKKIRDHTSILFAQLTEIGIQYQGAERGARAHFVKTAT